MKKADRITLLTTMGAALLFAFGCCSGAAPRTMTGASQGRNLSKRCLLEDIQLIVVTADGKTIPKEAKVRKGVQVVVWVADADELHIDFPANNPFPQQMQCQGRFCYSIYVPNGNAGYYDYAGTIKTGTTSTPIDPRIEIMN